MKQALCYSGCFILLTGIASVLAQDYENEGRGYEKAIPLVKEEKPGETVIAYRDEGVTLTLHPISATSQSHENSQTNALEQQMKLAAVQSVTTWLSITYGAGLGFRTEEVQLVRQPDQESTYFSLLNRPALAYKPREGMEVEAAYEMQQNLSERFTMNQSGAAILQGKTKITPQTTLGLGYRDEQRHAENGDTTSLRLASLTSEYEISDAPVKLQLNPGYAMSSTKNAMSGGKSPQSIRAFVEDAIIWKMNPATTFTFGTGFSGGDNNIGSGFIHLQHVIQHGTALELKAAMLQAERAMPGEGYTISAGSTVALAQALSAGLSVRYKMDENSTLNRPPNETFLSFSLNGKF